jgi:hypothetical protein
VFGVFGKGNMSRLQWWTISNLIEEMNSSSGIRVTGRHCASLVTIRKP